MARKQAEPSLVRVDLDRRKKKEIEGGRRPLSLVAQWQFVEEGRTLQLADCGKNFRIAHGSFFFCAFKNGLLILVHIDSSFHFFARPCFSVENLEKRGMSMAWKWISAHWQWQSTEVLSSRWTRENGENAEQTNAVKLDLQTKLFLCDFVGLYHHCIQKRPEKKDFIKYKQDVLPSRASSAKQRTEWPLFSVLLRKPVRAKRPVCI